MTGSKSKKIKILAIVGPTASGKSALALGLAGRLGGEIVSCDSMQVYRGMDIGTAKPSAAERAAIPHHLIDIADPWENFSAADYVAAAGEAVRGITGRGHLPIFVGGTGLYLDGFLRGGGFVAAGGDAALREELRREAASCGAEVLHARLAGIDPDSAAAIHPNNLRRVIRALEIYLTTGKTKTELDRASRQPDSDYDPVIIGLRFSDRAALCRRIDERVDAMLAAGLPGEVASLEAEGVFERSRTAAQAIGYKELLGYIRGESTLTEAADKLKRSTRRYAKRQMTWFCADPRVVWIEAGGAEADLSGIAARIWESGQ